MKVWDPLVRLLHWTLVFAIALAWISTLSLGIGWTHEPAGYATLGVITVRFVWGFVGGRYALFSQFIHKPGAVARYASLMQSRLEPRYIGHNPLGGWMVVALLTCAAGTAFTGWLQTTDRYWGSEPLELAHTWMAWGLLGLIALHVAGVVFTSVRHHENLILAMVSGRKSPPHGDDVA